MIRRWSMLVGLLAISFSYETLENQASGQGFGYPSCPNCFGYPQPQSNAAPYFSQPILSNQQWAQPTIDASQAPFHVEPYFQPPVYPSVSGLQPILVNPEIAQQTLSQPSPGNYNGFELSYQLPLPPQNVNPEYPTEGYSIVPMNQQTQVPSNNLVYPNENFPNHLGNLETHALPERSIVPGTIEGSIDPELTTSPSDIRETDGESKAFSSSPESSSEKEGELAKLKIELESIRSDLGRYVERARTAEERTYGLEKEATAQSLVAKEKEEALMKDIQRLNDQLADSAEKLSSTEKLVMERDGLMAELKTLQDSLKEAQKDKQKSEKAIEQQQSLRGQMEAMQKQLADAQSAVEEKAAEVKKLKQTSDETVQQFSKKEKELGARLEKLAVENKQDRMTSKEKEAFERNERELKTQIEALATRARDAEAEARKLVARNEENFKKSKAELNSKIQNLEQQLDKIKAEAKKSESDKEKQSRQLKEKNQKNAKPDTAAESRDSEREKRREERARRAKEAEREAPKKPDAEMKSKKETPAEPNLAPQRPRRPDQVDPNSTEEKDSAPESAKQSTPDKQEDDKHGKAPDQSEKTRLLKEKIRILEETMQTKLEQSRIRISNRIDEQKEKLIEGGAKEDGSEIKELEKKKQAELNNSSNKIRADYSGKLEEVQKELKQLLKAKSGDK